MSSPTEDVLKMITWLAAQDPTTLQARITINDAKASFGTENWDQMLEFANQNCPISSAYILLSKGTENTCLLGATYYHGNWDIMSPESLASWHQIDPATLKTRPLDSSLRFAHLAEEYPDCPFK